MEGNAAGDRKVHVLVVEDEVALARAYGRALRLVGCRVTLVHTLADAHRVLESEKVDRLLVDHELPDGTSTELALSAVREQGIPCLVVSGVLDLATRRRLREDGLIVITKPVSLRRICARLGELTLPTKERERLFGDILSELELTREAIDYGLSQSETAVLLLARTGESVDDVCEKRSVSRSTFNKQARSLREKFDASSLQEVLLTVHSRALGRRD